MGKALGSVTRILTGGVLAVGLGALGLVVLAGLVLAVVMPLSYADRLYPGVRTLGLDLGGRDSAEARQLVQAELDRYAQTTIPLRYASHTWQVTPASLGFTFDADRMVSDGYRLGRSGGMMTQLTARVQLLTNGEELPPAISVDERRLQQTLLKLNAETRKLPVNAVLEIRSDGTVEVIPSRTGQEIDLDAAAANVQASLLKLSTDGITLPSRDISVTVAESQLAAARERAQALIGQPLFLRHGTQQWMYMPRELSQWVVVRDEGGSVRVDWDDAKLSAAVTTIARSVNRQPVDAKLAIEDAKAVMTPSREGERVDIAMTIARIKGQVDGAERKIDLVVEKLPVRVETRHVQPARDRLDALLRGPVTLADGEARWTLDPADLAEWVRVEVAAQPEPRATVELDRQALVGFVKKVAAKLDRPAQNAQVFYRDGKIEVARREAPGRKVDVERTTDALARAMFSSERNVTPTFLAVEPRVTAASFSEVVVRDVIMEASSSYAGSIPERKHNVELAAQRLNGVVVAPGETFSFNEALGPATLRNGFKIGYGIAVNGSGDMVTIPSEAGGICQVSTTLFHAVFWAGYPVVERNWHLYWIPRYGQPPRGLKGLDATVDDQYGVDFRFRNSSAHPLVITTRIDGSTLTFVLQGVKPDWTVQVDNPIITNVVKANTDIVRQLDPTLPKGREMFIEQAQDGFDAAITRVVTRGTEVLDKWTARAHYRPSRNVILVGPS